MEKSIYACHSCGSIMYVTDSMVTATFTHDYILNKNTHDTGKKKFTVHWCELCAFESKSDNVRLMNE